MASKSWQFKKGHQTNKGWQQAQYSRYRFSEPGKYRPVNLRKLNKPRFQQGAWYLNYDPKWVAKTFKNVKNLNRHVAELMTQHFMLPLFRSMRGRAPVDTGKLRKAIKYVKVSSSMHGKDWTSGNQKYGSHGARRIVIDRVPYEHEPHVPPRSTIQAAWYQEKGYKMVAISRRWVDIDSRFFDGGIRRKMTARNYKPFIMPAIESIWRDKKRFNAIMKKAFQKTKSDWDKKIKAKVKKTGYQRAKKEEGQEDNGLPATYRDEG